MLTLIGGCRERVTPLRGSIGQAALGGFLGQSPESLGRAHNYESEARSYSGLYQGQALYLSPHPRYGLRHLLTMDEVYQILVDVALCKTSIHLELTAEVFRPEFVTEVIREQDYLSAYEFLHHPVRQVIANTNSQPIDIWIGQRTKHGSFLFLDDGGLSATIHMFTIEHVRVNIVVESVPRIEMVDESTFIEHGSIISTIVDDVATDYHSFTVNTRQYCSIMSSHQFSDRTQSIAHDELINNTEFLCFISYDLIQIVRQRGIVRHDVLPWYLYIGTLIGWSLGSEYLFQFFIVHVLFKLCNYAA